MLPRSDKVKARYKNTPRLLPGTSVGIFLKFIGLLGSVETNFHDLTVAPKSLGSDVFARLIAQKD